MKVERREIAMNGIASLRRGCFVFVVAAGVTGVVVGMVIDRLMKVQ